MDLDCQEVFKTIIKRRCDVRIRSTGDPLGREELADLLNAAHVALSVGNSQPWSLVVTRDPATLDVFAEHVAQCRQDYADSLDGGQREKLNPIKIEGVHEPGMEIVVTYGPTRFGSNVLGHHTISDVGVLLAVRAVQNLWLMATALDLGVGWVSFYQGSLLKELLGLPEQTGSAGQPCVDRVTKLQEVPDLTRFGWNHRITLEEVVRHDR